MIPEAAVEAAFQSMYAPGPSNPLSEDDAFLLRQLRAALEAAAPHMLPLGPHPTWSSDVTPASNAHIAYCPQCQANFGAYK